MAPRPSGPPKRFSEPLRKLNSDASRNSLVPSMFGEAGDFWADNGSPHVVQRQSKEAPATTSV